MEYVKGQELLRTFLSVYECQAIRCVNWILEEYHLRSMGEWREGKTFMIEPEVDEKYHNDFLPPLIRAEFASFDFQDIYCEGKSHIMEVINSDLEKCPDNKSRIRYTVNILSSFGKFAEPFFPNAYIKAKSKEIENVYQINGVENLVSFLKTEIDFHNNRSQKLHEICHNALAKEQNCEEIPIEWCLAYYWIIMQKFYKRLAALLLTYNIKLMDVQEYCDVYLSNIDSVTTYIDGQFVPTLSLAKKLLEEIEENNEHGKSEIFNNNSKGKNIKIFDDRLDEKKIASEIMKTDRNGLGEIDFTFAVHNVLEKICWLSITMDTRFVEWMKKYRIIKMMTKDLKKAKADSRTESVENSLLSTFQKKNENTGKQRDKIYYYRRNDAQLINPGV